MMINIDKYAKLFPMKLSQYAKNLGVTYRTAFRWWQQGQIKGHQLPNGGERPMRERMGMEAALPFRFFVPQ